eukprot:CAMPEP_0171116386 /NCGR_PEP_ID=MMETSP0766_2-20121228/90162_1 /TAXON_ID=439317 /ORGANISM="Gambierdiscus australes, Strain CAWD 149" /LENGTH=123 /DNA_ID=CAMNT_0011578821 /DNA_START=78 /DNA_END=446 /DNA_ORIENTATION=-
MKKSARWISQVERFTVLRGRPVLQACFGELWLCFSWLLATTGTRGQLLQQPGKVRAGGRVAALLRCEAVLVAALQPCTALKQEPCHWKVALLKGKHQRRGEVRQRRIDVAALLHEHVADIKVP